MDYGPTALLDFQTVNTMVRSLDELQMLTQNRDLRFQASTSVSAT